MLRHRCWMGLGVFLATGCAHPANTDGPLSTAKETLVQRGESPLESQCFLQTRDEAGDAIPSRLYGDFDVTLKTGVTGRENLHVQVGNRLPKTAEANIKADGWPCHVQHGHPDNEEKDLCLACVQIIPLLNPPTGQELKLKLGPSATLTVTDTQGKRHEFKGNQEFTLPPDVAQMNMACVGRLSKPE